MWRNGAFIKQEAEALSSLTTFSRRGSSDDRQHAGGAGGDAAAAAELQHLITLMSQETF